ncbi:MAG TPA: cytochrome P450 [Acidimicrobiales bacterium]|nr:cytochrome P450 [Acidimicrobiales bacterium]
MSDPKYDPYDVMINADPYPAWRRLRDEAPLYHDAEHDFYALSRHDDVERALVSWETFSSAKGAIVEVIQAGMQFPPGILLFEDPPIHTVHRGLLSRVFTPRKMHALEPQIRAFCAQSLDPLVGADEIDFIADLGAQMPMKVIGMLLGIPEEDQAAIRDQADRNLRVEEGKKMHMGEEKLDIGSDSFAEYIEWRSKHPSDDLMTELLTAEFEDETGTVRTLTREEVLTYVAVVAGAGNETTTRLIGWAGKVLSDFPDERKLLAEDPSLIPGAIEELLRFEPPAPHVARSVTSDVEYYGQTVPAGSVMLMLMGSANRDDRKYPDGDSFQARREVKGHLSFGFGLHFCLGAALARLEGRVALEEVLERFPAWTVDTSRARLSPTSTVRGWETLPASVG